MPINNIYNFQERERYKEPVRESLKALLALNWGVEHSEADAPLSHRGSTRRQSKPATVSLPYEPILIDFIVPSSISTKQCIPFFKIICIHHPLLVDTLCTCSLIAYIHPVYSIRQKFSNQRTFRMKGITHSITIHILWICPT